MRRRLFVKPIRHADKYNWKYCLDNNVLLCSTCYSQITEGLMLFQEYYERKYPDRYKKVMELNPPKLIPVNFERELKKLTGFRVR